jgi:hypothetical protein
MKGARWVWDGGIILFVILGIWLKISDQTIQGEYSNKWGAWSHSVLTGNALFFFAFIFLIVRIFVLRKQKNENIVDEPEKKKIIKKRKS